MRITIILPTQSLAANGAVHCFKDGLHNLHRHNLVVSSTIGSGEWT